MTSKAPKNRDLSHFKIRRVKTHDELAVVNTLAADIWPGIYTSLLPPGQMEYMFDAMYATPVLKKEHDEGIAYFVAYHDEVPVGYFSVELDCENSAGHLHKMYLRADMRGRGYGREMIESAAGWAAEHDIRILKLNVNKQNQNAIAFYESCGWKLLYPETTQLGEGFLKDDYVMGINLCDGEPAAKP